MSVSSLKFSTRLIQVSTRFGKTPGNAFAVSTKSVRKIIPAPSIIPKYFNGYPPTKTSITIIEKKIAVVEKLAGSINASTINTGTHSGSIVSLKVTVFPFMRER